MSEVADMTLTGAGNNTGPAYGGGLSLNMPTTVRRVAIVGNEDGGDEYNEQVYPAWGGGIRAGAPVTIEDSLIAGNEATVQKTGTMASGAGIYIGAPNSVIRNTTITGNLAVGADRPAQGGGLAVGGGGAVTVENATIAGNSAFGGTGSGGSNISVAPGGSITIRSSIVAKGQPTALGNCDSVPISLGGNVEDKATCFGVPDRPNTDPLLGPLSNNGGPTDTLPLLTGSPAIDFGGACVLTADQRGLPRPGGSACDSGAFETQLAAPAAKCSIGISGTIAKLEATVTCDVSATVTIGGTATIGPKPKKAKAATASKKKKKRPKPVTLIPTPGSTTLPGTPFRLTLTLPKKVRKAVKAGKRVSLDLILTARTADGATSTATAKVKKVKKPPRKKKRR